MKDDGTVVDNPEDADFAVETEYDDNGLVHSERWITFERGEK
jgi:hypothetical protein